MTTVRRDVAVTRRPATPDDIALLRSLFADAHLELACLPCDTRFVLVDMKFRARRRELAAGHPDATDQIILAGTAEAGRVLVDRAGEAIHIVDITVALGHRGNGIAHEVMVDLVREADETGRRIEVTAWSGNTAAVTLAEHAGFAAIRDEAGYVTYRREPRA
ncbi:MAG TPA: GNAT family N-acetyltransferase [Jatrophihabitans sp.]|jgi:GNAT superfamily N-acetyltransferase